MEAALPPRPKERGPRARNMMEYSLTTVICYCSNDYRFIKKCIDEALHFSYEVIVPVCDHFFDGSKEDLALLLQTYVENPKALFIQFAYYPDKLYSPHLEGHNFYENRSILWHSTARYIGYLYASLKSTHILFLDADEIVEGKKFAKWLQAKSFLEYVALRFSCYFYFRYSYLQSKENQYQLSLLVNKSVLNPAIILNPNERFGIYSKIQGYKICGVLGLDAKPMIHHYSWVKTKEECLKKTKTWGHFWEKDWEKEIEEEFARSFSTADKDFVFNFTYQKVKPYFDSLKIVVKKKKDLPSAQNVIFVDKKSVFSKALEIEFAIDNSFLYS